MRSSVALLALASLSSYVSAHGFVSSVINNNKAYSAFLPDYDLWNGEAKTKATRHVPNDGPVTDLTSVDMRCNVGAQDSQWRTPAHVPVDAGSQVSFQWSRWPTDHHGPITVYMANCGGDCTNFDGDGAVWFKIDQEGLLSGTTDGNGWATDLLIANKVTWTATIPSTLKAGAYLIRIEILALHSAGAPQFYPSCTQLVVSGSGSGVPASSELVAIPGIYKAGDASSGINIWNNGVSAYTIAGPAVTKLAKFETDPINGKGGLSTIPTTVGTVVKGNTASTSGGSSSSGGDDGDATPASSSASAAATTTKKGSAATTKTTAAAAAATTTNKTKACKIKKRNVENTLETNAARRMSKRHVDARKRRMGVEA